MRLLLLTPLFIQTLVYAQTRAASCAPFFLDDFSNPSNWTVQNSGGTTLDGNTLQISAYCSVPNKVYQTLPDTLPDNMWRAETDFHLLSTNSSGHGTGGYAIAFTAGDQDFMSEPLGGGSYYETNQDGLAVVVNSPATDNNITNWFFIIEAKNGSSRVWDLNLKIPFVVGVYDYYILFERTSASTASLSVYSDAARSQHIPGSPVTYTINPLITGLNTIQHSASTPGNAARYFNARMDNDLICLPANELNEPVSAENSMISATVFPNPATDQFEIQLSDNSLIEKILLVDMSGKRCAVLVPETNGKNEFSFPEFLTEGFYFAEIITQQQQHLSLKIQKSQR